MKTHGHTHTHTHIHTHIYTHIHTHIHTHTYTHTHIQLKHVAQRHAYSQPIETYSLAPHNRNIWPSPTPTANQYKHMAQRHIIETYGHTIAGRRSFVCASADSFVLVSPVYPLLLLLLPLLLPLFPLPLPLLPLLVQAIYRLTLRLISPLPFPPLIMALCQSVYICLSVCLNP